MLSESIDAERTWSPLFDRALVLGAILCVQVAPITALGPGKERERLGLIMFHGIESAGGCDHPAERKAGFGH